MTQGEITITLFTLGYIVAFIIGWLSCWVGYWNSGSGSDD